MNDNMFGCNQLSCVLTIQLMIISTSVHLISSKPIIIDTSNSTTNASTGSTPMPLLVSCRAGTYIRRDCKFYIDCYRGHWRRNFCPEHKVWNHDLKKCDDIHNVPECLAIYEDMKHSPVIPKEYNHLTDEERNNVDKPKNILKKPNHKPNGKEEEQEMIIEENRFGNPDKSSAHKIEPKINKTPKQKPESEDNPQVINDKKNLIDYEWRGRADTQCRTRIYEIKIDESVFNLFRSCFYYISLFFYFLKS